ncbi:hypothetical protein ACIQOF_25115 [Streptomyces sp. NPDC091265]|uniref:hypothetical protein n=1 Tax=unclassified Streptomyces TaxID=2593676 RepID=UPI00344F5D7A
MNSRSGRTDRWRGARAPMVLGWVFVLLAMVSCCSLTSTQPTPPHHGPFSLAAPRTTAPAPPATAMRAVVAEAPGARGIGSSCHHASQHATPVVLPAQAAPAALPSATTALAAGTLTGSAGIRGPTNDAVSDVDHLRLQVQRI